MNLRAVQVLILAFVMAFIGLPHGGSHSKADWAATGSAVASLTSTAVQATSHETGAHPGNHGKPDSCVPVTVCQAAVPAAVASTSGQEAVTVIYLWAYDSSRGRLAEPDLRPPKLIVRL